MGAFRWLRDRQDVVRAVSGAVLVAFGLLLFFDRLWWLNVPLNRLLTSLGLDGLPRLWAAHGGALARARPRGSPPIDSAP